MENRQETWERDRRTWIKVLEGIKLGTLWFHGTHLNHRDAPDSYYYQSVGSSLWVRLWLLCVFPVRHPGGEAEAHPDDIAELDSPQSITTKCLLHQATETTAAPPGVQTETNTRTSAHLQTSQRRRPERRNSVRGTTNKPAIREVPLLLFSSCCVPGRLHGNGPGVGITWPQCEKALAELWPGRRSEECVFSCKYPAALLTETPWLKVLLLTTRSVGSTRRGTRGGFLFFIYDDGRQKGFCMRGNSKCRRLHSYNRQARSQRGQTISSRLINTSRSIYTFH